MQTSRFWKGIDLETGEIGDMMASGVLEPCGVKVSALSLAVEAACTLIKASRKRYNTSHLHVYYSFRYSHSCSH